MKEETKSALKEIIAYEKSVDRSQPRHLWPKPPWSKTVTNREKIIDRVYLMLREQGCVFNCEFKNETVVFEGEIFVGKIVDLVYEIGYKDGFEANNDED